MSKATHYYQTLLEHSFKMENEVSECSPESRLAFLAVNIFNFTTYDGEMDELFARKAVEVCAAINNSATFDYIKDADNYRWFLLMCNMPFFYRRLTWGTSIRGAWWDIDRKKTSEISSCGLWDGDEQLLNLRFDNAEWVAFIHAMIDFASSDLLRKGT